MLHSVIAHFYLSAPKLDKQTLQLELQPPEEQIQRPDRKPNYTSAAVSGNATREQKAAGQPTGQITGQDSRVVQVQATGTTRSQHLQFRDAPI